MDERARARRSARSRDAGRGDRRIRVLLAIDEMEVGGTQRQIVQLARSLDAGQFAVELVYFRFSSFLLDELKSLGVKVHLCAKRGRVDPFFFRALRALLLEGRYDIVHAFSFSSELWCALALRARVFGRSPVLISSVRGTYEWYTRTQWWLKAWVSRRSAAIIANSEAGARYAEQQAGLVPGRIVVVPNGLGDPAPAVQAERARQRLRAAMALRPDTVLVLFVGRLVAVKNVGTLIDAFARAAQTRPALHLAIAGDGDLRATLQEKARTPGLAGRISWLGERRDVPALMDASDMVVLPSWREGLSNVILEAMLMSRPVLASRTGGNVESVRDGVTGLLFEPGDVDALADALATLADDGGLAQRLGLAGRQRALRCYGLQALAHRMASHYRLALGLVDPQAGEQEEGRSMDMDGRGSLEPVGGRASGPEAQ